MSSFPVLIDSNIAIQLLKGSEAVVEFLDARQTYISFISEVELLGWSKLSEVEILAIQEFFADCNYLDYSFQIKNEAIQLIRKHNLKLPDAFIAATALYYHLPLFTSDKIFNRVSEISKIGFDPSTGFIS
jgi:predicted nucleic acid-binding protein